MVPEVPEVPQVPEVQVPRVRGVRGVRGVPGLLSAAISIGASGLCGKFFKLRTSRPHKLSIIRNDLSWLVGCTTAAMGFSTFQEIGAWQRAYRDFARFARIAKAS